MRESRYNFWVEDAGARHVYNGLSGAVVTVPAAAWESVEAFLAGADREDADAELLHRLVVGRMIITDDTDEVAVLRDRYRRTRHGAEVFHLTVVTSLGCNFDCPYCFEAKHPSLLGDAVRERLLRLVEVRLATAEAFSVTWYGGEPLVGKAALYALSDAFRERAAAARVRYDATIVTNGYLLTRQVAVELRDRDVRSAQVTLDGPAEIHDRRRPLAGGQGTFATVLANITAAADVLPLTVRMNLDEENADAYESFLDALVEAGLAGRVGVSAGHVVAPAADPRAPSANYATARLSRPAFAALERRFFAAAEERGFAGPGLPGPVGAPCTAVRRNELIVGSRGELYKCTETVGDPNEVVGNLADWPRGDDRMHKWLAYDPFADAECRACKALPVCMGGCAYHSMDPDLHDSRCSTFRFTHEQQVRHLIARTTRSA